MTQTFQEMLTSEQFVYPEWVDLVTQSVISDWFSYRHVANDNLFPLWFRRQLQRDYPRYMELLRIEARTAGSEYDWLVTNYEERETKALGQDASSTTNENTGSVNNTRTLNAGVTETTQDSGGENRNSTITERGTGTDTAVRNPNLQTYTTGNSSENSNASENGTRTPNLISIDSGSGNDTTRHGALTRQAPYSADYGTVTSATNVNVAHTVGPAGVDTGEIGETNAAQFKKGFPNLNISNPTTAADELSDSARVNFNKNTQSGNETTAKQSSGSGSSAHNESVQTTGTETTTDYRDTTDTTTTGENISRNGTRTVSRGGSDTETTENTSNGTTNGSSQSAYSHLDRTIFTGRTGHSPQELLRDAVSFVQDTSAWAWLYKKLDTCFLMVYNTDSYEITN